jgi:hypothetical protein
MTTHLHSHDGFAARHNTQNIWESASSDGYSDGADGAGDSDDNHNYYDNGVALERQQVPRRVLYPASLQTEDDRVLKAMRLRRSALALNKKYRQTFDDKTTSAAVASNKGCWQFLKEHRLLPGTAMELKSLTRKYNDLLQENTALQMKLTATKDE